MRDTGLFIFAAALALWPLLGHSNGSHGTETEAFSFPQALYEDTMPSHGHVYVLPGQEVVVARASGTAPRPQASLFTHGAMPTEQLIERMLWLMDSTGSDHVTLIEARQRLTESREVNEQETFDISFAGIAGASYRFVLESSGYNQLYVLTYEKLD